MTCFILLPQVPAWFMTSLIQTHAGYNMTTLAVVFLRLSEAVFVCVFFNKQGEQSSEKLQYAFPPLSSILVNRARHTSSDRFPFRHTGHRNTVSSDL